MFRFYITQTNGTKHEILIDAEDVPLLEDKTFWVSPEGYACYYIKKSNPRKNSSLHRLILGVTDSQVCTDHINGDRLDNRKENLRVCTRQTNMFNLKPRKGTSSKYKGVWFCPRLNKYQAYINKDKKRTNLGWFENEEDAAIAYNTAAPSVHGVFARLNVLQELRY